MKRIAAILILCCSVVPTVMFAQAGLDRGKDLLNQGKTNEGIAVLRQFVETNPKSVDAWMLLGEAYLKVSNLDSAKLAGEKVISLDETNVGGYLLAADVARRQKDLTGAYNALKSGLAEKKNDLRLLTQLGFVLLEADSVDQAIVALSRAKEVDPNSALIYQGLGEAYSRQGVTPFAITQYEKSVELDSTRADVHNSLAKLYYKEHRYNDAAREYKRVAALDTTNQAALLELARMYMSSRPKLYVDAAEVLKIYVRRFPNAEDVWPSYTEALYFTGQYSDAIKAAQRGLKNEPKNGDELRYLASSQARLKQYKESVASYTQLRSVESLKIGDLVELAEDYSALKNDTLTLKTYEEIVKIKPDIKAVYINMGTIYMSWQQWEPAAVMFQKAMALDSTHYSLFVNYALCEMVLGRSDNAHFDSARVALRYVTSKVPDYAPGHLYLAQSLISVSVDSLAEARKEYETWIKLIPANEESKYKRDLSEAYKNIGASYLKEKKYPQAIESLSKALKYKEDDWQTHLWIGQANQLSGDKDKAIEEYRRVLKLNPTNKDAKNMLIALGIAVD
jgi:tetratricopeptide (TPR) repeat protein